MIPAAPTAEEVRRLVGETEPEIGRLKALTEVIEESYLVHCAVAMANSAIDTGVIQVPEGVDGVSRVTSLTMASMSIGLDAGLMIGEARAKAEVERLTQALLKISTSSSYGNEIASELKEVAREALA